MPRTTSLPALPLVTYLLPLSRTIKYRIHASLRNVKQAAICLLERRKLNMSSTEELHQKIDTLAKDLQSVSAAVAQNDAGRKKLLGLLMKVTAELEAPIETIWRMIMSVRLLRKTRHRRVYTNTN